MRTLIRAAVAAAVTGLLIWLPPPERRRCPHPPTRPGPAQPRQPWPWPAPRPVPTDGRRGRPATDQIDGRPLISAGFRP